MSTEEVNKYKDTIHLPKTDFPMRGNLPETEPLMIQKWEAQQTYFGMIEQPTGQRFVMPDGPPYANGHIHLGHVLNKVLKDIVIKYKNLSGHPASFIPGWDCHGLPIELNITKKLGAKRQEIEDKEIRQLCREEASQWVQTQKEQFKRLGILADWENPYLTMQPSYEASEIRALADILDNGILVRGEKPVYWCPTLQTALAAAEVEYHDHKSPSIYVKFYNHEKTEWWDPQLQPVSFVIWTTTPWTLPANYAIAIHPDFEYGLYESDNENFIFAKGLKENIEKATGKTFTEKKIFRGSQLEGLKAKHPFLDRDSSLILGTHVTLEAGTGCVHTAPGHGLDDYNVGLKYNLPVASPVDESGRYTSEFPEMEGLKIWAANPKIVEKLVNSGHMLHHSELVHSYPHNPRSKTPLIFRATPQWFIKMDDEKYPLRQKALKSAEQDITYVPEWGAQRLIGMLTNSPDWCVSRQRLWGVPIPVFYCKSCGQALADSELMQKIANEMETSGLGIEAFYQKSAEDWTLGYSCSNCGHQHFTKSKDILDVWFDSGICHTAVQKNRKGLAFPADIYLEGSDQHRGWFQTSLLSSLATYGEPPFKALITHGFVNDAEGKKMSKSKGNVIDPGQVIKMHGAEILRLWVAYEDYGQDVNVSDEMFKRITETYRRIRNTLRFLLGNLGDFDPVRDKVSHEQMTPLDQWALARFYQVIERVRQAYESYNFYKVYHTLNQFFTVDLSATYLDILKDRLYTWKKDGRERRSSQTVIYFLLNELVVMMAPILSFLAEETYQYIPGKAKESVFLCNFPEEKKAWHNPQLLTQFEKVFELRNIILQKLEDLRKNKVIGSNLDACVTLTAPASTLEVLKAVGSIKEIFIVSQFDMKSGEILKIEVNKALGKKCIRCWHFSEEIGKNKEHSEICPKCIEALT